MTNEQLLGEVDDLLRTMPEREAIKNGDGQAWLGRALAVIDRCNKPPQAQAASYAATDIVARDPNTSRQGYRRLLTVLHQVRADLGLSQSPAAAGDQALMDVLIPGIQNRRGFEQAFAARTKESGRPLCLAFFDIDNFKDVNDNQGGHKIGDEALISIGSLALACVEGKGSAFRYGGDEFMMLLPNHTLQEGLAVAERFRCEVNGTKQTSRQLTLSVSVGVAEWPTHGADLEAIKGAVDGALYDSKQRGRNLVRYYREPEPTTETPREPDRRVPEPGGLSAEEGDAIRKQYFRTGAAACPRDDARLDVIDTTGFGQTTKSIYVACPLCGLSAELK